MFGQTYRYPPGGCGGILRLGCSMPDYRLYRMNQLGHIEEAGDFDADNDAAAIGAVERVRGDATMELWCGTRKVRHWDAVLVSSPTDSG